MARTPENVNLEHDFVQLLTKEAVKIGLESPLRESILEAFEERTSSTDKTASEEESFESISEDDITEGSQKSRFTKVVQGGTVFIVLFVVLYVTLRRLTSDEAVK